MTDDPVLPFMCPDLKALLKSLFNRIIKPEIMKDNTSKFIFAQTFCGSLWWQFDRKLKIVPGFTAQKEIPEATSTEKCHFPTFLLKSVVLLQKSLRQFKTKFH